MDDYVLFKDLDINDVFKIGSIIYVKIHPVYEVTTERMVANVYCITKGTAIYIDDSASVRKLFSIKKLLKEGCFDLPTER